MEREVDHEGRSPGGLVGIKGARPVLVLEEGAGQHDPHRPGCPRSLEDEGEVVPRRFDEHLDRRPRR